MTTCINTITSAAPMVVNRGTKDIPGAVLPVAPKPLPQHLPIWFFQGARGVLGPSLTSAAERDAKYGSETFDETGRFANHATPYINTSVKAGNTALYWRLSKGKVANIVLYIDVAETTIDLLKRDSLGNIVINKQGQTETIGTTPGFACRWRVGHSNEFNKSATGTLTPTAGDIQGGSTKYPIYEKSSSSPGTDGGNHGFRLYDSRPSNINITEMVRTKSYPYTFSLIKRPSANESAIIEDNIMGDKSTMVSFSPRANRKSDGSSYHLADVMVERFSNTVDTRYPLRYPSFDNIHVYQENIDLILKKFMKSEIDFIAAHPDTITGTPTDIITPDVSAGEEHLFNFVGGKDHTGVPYYTFTFDEDINITDGVRLSSITNVWAKGGSDDLMSVTEFEREIRKVMARYNDCNDILQDLATHPVSILYDTGYSELTKMILPLFISQRPDTFLALQTHIDTTQVRGYVGGEPALADRPDDYIEPKVGKLTEIEEMALATALRSKLLLQPESEYFGTPTMRALIMSRSGILRVGRTKKRVGFNMWLVKKASEMMGASNGEWDRSKTFSRAPGNIIDNLYDVDHPWIAARRRLRIHDIGINYPLTYDMERLFMPLLQTIHPNDSSVLNSFPMAMAICYCYKVGYMAWREFSGANDLTADELITLVDNFVTAKLSGVFTNDIKIKSRAYVTSDDIARQYSWGLAIEASAGPQYSVERLHIESKHFENYAGGITNG